MGPSLLFTIATGREQMHQQPWQQTLVVLLHMHILGCVRLGNLDLDFKVRISDLQSNAKSENGFQRQNICFWIFLFTVRMENPKKDLKNCLYEQRSYMRTHN